MNLQMGKVYMTNADPKTATRIWQEAMDEGCKRAQSEPGEMFSVVNSSLTRLVLQVYFVLFGFLERFQEYCGRQAGLGWLAGAPASWTAAALPQSKTSRNFSCALAKTLPQLY
jgi:hypothetical protein